MTDTSEVTDYLNRFDGEVYGRLQTMRSLVSEIVPDATESFSYGLIGYKLNSKPLIYFGGFKEHVGLYATPNGHDAFKEEFSVYRQGKGSVQLPNSQPLPIELIRRVIEYRRKTIQNTH